MPKVISSTKCEDKVPFEYLTRHHSNVYKINDILHTQTQVQMHKEQFIISFSIMLNPINK